jgi:hypothetical protein
LVVPQNAGVIDKNMNDFVTQFRFEFCDGFTVGDIDAFDSADTNLAEFAAGMAANTDNVVAAGM